MVELLSFQFLTTLTLVTFCFDFYSDILKKAMFISVFLLGATQSMTKQYWVIVYV